MPNLAKSRKYRSVEAVYFGKCPFPESFLVSAVGLARVTVVSELFRVNGLNITNGESGFVKFGGKKHLSPPYTTRKMI